MKERVETFTYADGSIQRVQAVTLPGFAEAGFFFPAPSDAAFARIVRLYRSYAVPRAPYIFDQMVLFRLPGDVPASLPGPAETERYGALSGPLMRAAAVLRRGVRVLYGRPVFLNADARALWEFLVGRGCLEVVSGLLPTTSVLPVSDRLGLLSQCEPQAALKANLSFFTMDKFDVCSVYDAIGTPIGLRVRDGQIQSPPLFEREALLAMRSGEVRIEKPALTSLGVRIRGTEYRHGENAVFYTRPACRRTPRHAGTDIVILENRVAARHTGGGTAVPGAGFVLSTGRADAMPGDPVSFAGMEDVLFGVQVGNSAVINGVSAAGFTSPFYNIKRPFGPPYPPSLYPTDFKNARAPRMALGVDKHGTPLLVWAEGPGKLGFQKGVDSRGASLAEMGRLCLSVGMVTGVNLDGGGSAQILLGNRRSLLISDRNPDNTESERAVPVGLIVRG